jgi:hypothetical protein
VIFFTSYWAFLIIRKNSRTKRKRDAEVKRQQVIETVEAAVRNARKETNRQKEKEINQEIDAISKKIKREKLEAQSLDKKQLESRACAFREATRESFESKLKSNPELKKEKKSLGFCSKGATSFGSVLDGIKRSHETRVAKYFNQQRKFSRQLEIDLARREEEFSRETRSLQEQIGMMSSFPVSFKQEQNSKAKKASSDYFERKEELRAKLLRLALGQASKEESLIEQLFEKKLSMSGQFEEELASKEKEVQKISKEILQIEECVGRKKREMDTEKGEISQRFGEIVMKMEVCRMKSENFALENKKLKRRSRNHLTDKENIFKQMSEILRKLLIKIKLHFVLILFL